MPFVIPVDGDPGGGGGSTPAPPSNAISNLGVVADSNLHGDIVSFSVNNISNVGQIDVMRGTSSDFTSAVFIHEATKITGPQSYHDTDPVLPGGIWYYWIRVYNSDLSLIEVFGSVSVSLKSGFANPPNPLDWFDASHDAGDGTSVEVHVSINLVPGTDFAALRVYVNGYRGSIVDTLMSEEGAQRFSFKLAQTGENVTLKGTVVSNLGTEQSLATALTKVITLAAPQTVPAKVSKLTASNGTAFTQVTFDGGLESAITAYRMYRVARGGIFSGAVLVQAIIPTVDDRYTMTDPQQGNFQWYITAVNAAGESLPSDPIWPAL